MHTKTKPNPATPLLICTHPAESAREFHLDQEETVIGRGSGASVRLEGASVSRRHARILRKETGFFLEDLGSSNGTFLNGKRIQGSARLAPSDQVRVGSFSFRFEPGPEQADAADVTIQRQTVASPANEELYRENAARKLQAVLQLAHDLGNTLEVEVLLQRVIAQLAQLFPFSERISIILFEENNPVVRVTRDRRAHPGNEPLYSRTLLNRMIELGIGVLAEDTSGLDSGKTLRAAGVHSLLCVPLRAHGTPVFGAVQVDRFQHDHPFTPDDLHLLTAVSLQVGMALDKARLHERLLTQERIARELALAREIQLAFLPKGPPELAAGSVDLFTELNPAEEVSGDFYDVIPLDDRRLALVVADVSGKGMPAALFMSMVRVLLRQLAHANASPAKWLCDLNRTLARDNPKAMFVTIALAVYDRLSGECRIARGGHPAPLRLPGDGAVGEIEVGAGCLIGFADEARIDERVLALKAGEILIFYSDGVTEAFDSGGQMFGLHRLKEAARSVPRDAPLSVMAETIRGNVHRFCAPALPQDDLTLLLLRHPG